MYRVRRRGGTRRARRCGLDPGPGAVAHPGRHDAIRAIVEPAFGPDWSDLPGSLGIATRPRLEPDDLVIAVEHDGHPRAYPLQVFYNHEVVNDDLGGPLVATYCPICGSSVVADRTIDGQPATFGVSGYLWRADLVMYDTLTDSLWSQIAATAIRGPAAGTTLSLRPSTLTTWRDWRAGHPDTDVLVPVPLSRAVGRALDRPYYTPYRTFQLFGDRVGVESHMAVKGLVVNGRARAYPVPTLDRARVVNDRIGGHPVLVAMVGDAHVVAYDRCVAGTALRFEPACDGRATAGGSRWRLDTGVAEDGPWAGSRLGRLGGLPPMFWFAWRDFAPETDVYGAHEG